MIADAVLGWVAVMIGAGVVFLASVAWQALADGRRDDAANGRLEEQVDQ